jgi:hypothetical protein
MSLRRITRDRHLSSEEVVEYRKIREQIAEELPELITRHDERLAARSGQRLNTTREILKRSDR